MLGLKLSDDHQIIINDETKSKIANSISQYILDHWDSVATTYDNSYFDTDDNKKIFETSFHIEL